MSNGMSPVVNHMNAGNQPRQPGTQQQQAMPSRPLQPMRQFNVRPVPGAANIPSSAGMSPLGDQLAMRPAPPPHNQRRVDLGERLYPLVLEYDSARASKITGMLLSLPESEVLAFMQSKEELKAKVEEAIKVIEKRQKGAEQQASQNRGDIDAAGTATVSAKEA